MKFFPCGFGFQDRKAEKDSCVFLLMDVGLTDELNCGFLIKHIWVNQQCSKSLTGTAVKHQEHDMHSLQIRLLTAQRVSWGASAKCRASFGLDLCALNGKTSYHQILWSIYEYHRHRWTVQRSDLLNFRLIKSPIILMPNVTALILQEMWWQNILLLSE